MSYKFCFAFVLAFLELALSTEVPPDPKSLLAPCHLGDMECLKTSTDLFLRQTHKGITDHGILPLDPLIIPSLDVASNEKKFLNRNITVTGLAQQTLHDFKMDVKTSSVTLTTSADLTVIGNTTLVLGSTNVDGHFWSHGRVLGTAYYSYTLKPDEKGVEHFVVGPETLSCETVGNPTVVFTSHLAQLCNDTSCPDDIKESWKNNFCQIVETAYKSVVHNIRAAASVVPSTAFFKNLHQN